jgi:hypothetical protein
MNFLDEYIHDLGSERQIYQKIENRADFLYFEKQSISRDHYDLILKIAGRLLGHGYDFGQTEYKFFVRLLVKYLYYVY